MKVSVIERHYASTRDVEGFTVDESRMDEGSDEFKRYMEEFRVLEKYEKRREAERACYVVLNKENDEICTASGYYSGMVKIFSTVPARTEYCYIIIEERTRVR